MLSQNQELKASRAPKSAYAPIEGFRTVRLKFTKTGSMQYISHLDLQRNFARVLTRAGIPVWYTKGFNPHAKIVFALPLSIGAQSVCEYIDLRIERDMSCEEIAARLNAEMTDEMQVIEAYIPAPDTAFADIIWAEYDIDIRCDGLSDEMPAAVQNYLTTSPIMIEKKSKSGLREVDMVTLVRAVEATLAENDGVRSLHLRCILGASGTDYLNPEYVVKVIAARFSLLQGDPAAEEYTVMRRRVLLSDGKTEFR